MEGDNTTVEESTGTSSEIQGNYEKYKKSGEFLDFSPYIFYLWHIGIAWILKKCSGIYSTLQVNGKQS